MSNHRSLLSIPPNIDQSHSDGDPNHTHSKHPPAPKPRPPINRRVDLRGPSVQDVSGDPRSFSDWRRSRVICCRVAALRAATKPVGYLLLD
jgi:hypothetical protein